MPASSPPADPPISRRRRITLGIVPSTAFMGDVDATILGITPPRIRRDLGAARSPAGHALAFSPLGAVLSVGNAGAPPLGRPLPAPPTTAS